MLKHFCHCLQKLISIVVLAGCATGMDLSTSTVTGVTQIKAIEINSPMLQDCGNMAAQYYWSVNVSKEVKLEYSYIRTMQYCKLKYGKDLMKELRHTLCINYSATTSDIWIGYLLHYI